MKSIVLLSTALLLLLISCGRHHSDSDSTQYDPWANPMWGPNPYSYPYPYAIPYGYSYTYPSPTYYPVPVIDSTMRFPAGTPLRTRMEGKLVGAHQGGAMSLGANTLPRFEEAFQLGVDIIEMDLQLTKDNVVIVYHDNYLDRFTDCEGLVIDKTWDEIKKCDKLFFYKIPSLEEVLQWSNGKVIINAEFKFQESIIPTLNLVKKYNAYDWVYFQTKSDPVLYHTARDYDDQVALLFAPNDQTQLDWALGLNDDNLVVIELSEDFISADIIDAIHDAGKLASDNSWHFSSTREIFGAACTPLFEMNIDIAITDKPEGCIEQRADL
ncbi:MAG: glycerophosphodiester phosphodiesterase [Bacteriovoracaceae bacterium]